MLLHMPSDILFVYMCIYTHMLYIFLKHLKVNVRYVICLHLNISVYVFLKKKKKTFFYKPMCSYQSQWHECGTLIYKYILPASLLMSFIVEKNPATYF